QTSTMRFDILTIFPEFFGALPDQGILGHGVVSRALRTGLASAHIHDLRTFTHDRHRTVDDRPFGGGEGMVLKPQPIYEALQSLALPTSPPARPPSLSAKPWSCSPRRASASPSPPHAASPPSTA